jgi:hypothetical protein
MWAGLTDRGEAAVVIECRRCGGLTISETVIKLRRSLFGFRETRLQGAYCAACKLSVPLEDQPTAQSMTVEAGPRLQPRLVYPTKAARLADGARSRQLHGAYSFAFAAAKWRMAIEISRPSARPSSNDCSPMR